MAPVAILCYHSWNLDLALLTRDIEHLRRAGWRSVSLDCLLGIARCDSPPGKRLFHVTNDDASPFDEPFARELERLDCPATFFVATGLIPEERQEHYQTLDRSGLIAVEDHSLMHRKRFRGGRVIEFWSETARTTGLSEGPFELGMPVVEHGSELAGPLFTIDPAAIELCRSKAFEMAIDKHSKLDLELRRLLVVRNMADRRHDGLYIHGSFESRELYHRRIAESLSDGRDRFRQLFGRNPRAFCYPFFQWSGETDEVLRRLGYELTFIGESRNWVGEHLAPRIPLDNATPRPLDLERLTRVRFRSRVRRRLRSAAESGRRLLLSRTRSRQCLGLEVGDQDYLRRIHSQ